ncbi:MAG: DnaJ domain-containing protein [Thermomicrobiales bacterium]
MPVEFKDYYAVLGIARTADQTEIKRAFRENARKFHPDVNRSDPRAEERFKDINEAYEVLSDPDKRARYDRFGRDWQRYREASRSQDREAASPPPRGGASSSQRTTAGPSSGGGARSSGAAGSSGRRTDDFEDAPPLGGGEAASRSWLRDASR